MKQLTNYRDRLRRRVVAALAVAVAMLVVGGAASSAWASSFNCESRGDGSTCRKLSGPNQTMEEGEGDNYTSAEFELVFWKYNGGSTLKFTTRPFTHTSAISATRVCSMVTWKCMPGNLTISPVIK
jgi:hypothetical protein